MGQRSQIYIRIQDNYNEYPKLYAKYYGWNFGERMISRARHGIEYIKSYMEYIYDKYNQEKINRIFDINFDMKDIALTSDLIKEWVRDFSDSDIANDYIFEDTANNDGKLFIDVQKDGTIKYCFADYNLKILTPTKYMNWDCESWKTSDVLTEEEKEICKNNIKYINENATLMTEDELQEFIDYDYSKQIIELANDLNIEIAPEKLRKENFNLQITEPNQDEIDICE